MTGQAHILIVDDDPTLRQLMVDTLEALQYEVSAATDGIEALELLRDQAIAPFDLLLTDVKMPNMDGFTLLKKIRRLHPELPVLFITGVFSDTTMAAASPDGYLAKPFRIARLEELIERTLKARATSRPASPPRRVLINIRQKDLRESIAEAMALSNYMPFAVTRNEEAVQELERGSFDAVITGSEEVNRSTEWVDRLRTVRPSLPMLWTDDPADSPLTPDTGPGLPIDGVVKQPFSAGDLIELLDQTMAAHPRTGH